MVSIWRLAGVAEFRKTKSTPARPATSSKVIGSVWGAAATREIRTMTTPAAILDANSSVEYHGRRMVELTPSVAGAYFRLLSLASYRLTCGHSFNILRRTMQSPSLTTFRRLAGALFIAALMVAPLRPAQETE